MTLLEDIQAAALDSSVGLPDMLRRCKVLAARLKHQEFGLWVQKELNGYGADDEIPPYRQLHVQSVGHFDRGFGAGIRNAPIPPRAIPEEFRAVVTDRPVTGSVGRLQASCAAATEGVLQVRWPADLIVYLQHNVPIFEHASLLDAFQLLPVSALMGILDTVRTRALDFVLAIEAENPEAGEAGQNAPPGIPVERLGAIYNVTITGGQAIIGTGGDATLSVQYAVPPERRGEIEELVREMEQHAAEISDPEERAEATGIVRKLARQFTLDKPEPERLRSYLQLYATIVTAAAPTVDALHRLLHAIGWLT